MIRVNLTPEQVRSIRKGAGHLELTEDQALSVRGKLTAAAGAGRPLSKAPRCPCGEMTLARAKARGHRC